MEEAGQVDDLMDKSGSTSPEALGSRFDIELGGVIRQLPGKQFVKVLL
jgi:hypothetical protein